MSRYAYTDRDPSLFTVWWLNEAKDADMDCGSFATQEEAAAALPGILAGLLAECANNDDQEDALLCGSFNLEFPETYFGRRGHTEPMDWPEMAP